MLYAFVKPHARRVSFRHQHLAQRTRRVDIADEIVMLGLDAERACFVAVRSSRGISSLMLLMLMRSRG